MNEYDRKVEWIYDNIFFWLFHKFKKSSIKIKLVAFPFCFIWFGVTFFIMYVPLMYFLIRSLVKNKSSLKDMLDYWFK